MATFNLNGLGTPKGATYDNESAYTLIPQHYYKIFFLST